MKLAYREFGEGQPLLILHGLFGQSDNWNTLAKQFAEKGFRVFAIDQRNHGLSPHSEEWDYPAMAADLKEFTEDLGLEHPVLLGHSMGGKTVLYFEYLYPGEAKKIIVADMAARRYEAHHHAVLKALHAVNFDLVHSRREAEAIMDEYIKDFGTKQFLLKNIYWKDAGNQRMDWRFNLEVISKEYDNIRVEVPAFVSQTPALIVRGEKSDYVQEADVQDYKKRFTNLDLEIIAGAGHWVHAEKPKEFFEAVIRFTGV